MLGTFRIVITNPSRVVRGFVQYQVFDRNGILRYEGAYSECQQFIRNIELNRLNEFE